MKYKTTFISTPISNMELYCISGTTWSLGENATQHHQHTQEMKAYGTKRHRVLSTHLKATNKWKTEKSFPTNEVMCNGGKKIEAIPGWEMEGSENENMQCMTPVLSFSICSARGSAAAGWGSTVIGTCCSLARSWKQHKKRDVVRWTCVKGLTLIPAQSHQTRARELE